MGSWGTLGRAQGRPSAARLNDVLGEEPFGPQPIYIEMKRPLFLHPLCLARTLVLSVLRVSGV